MVNSVRNAARRVPDAMKKIALVFTAALIFLLVGGCGTSDPPVIDEADTAPTFAERLVGRYTADAVPAGRFLFAYTCSL